MPLPSNSFKKGIDDLTAHLGRSGQEVSDVLFLKAGLMAAVVVVSGGGQLWTVQWQVHKYPSRRHLSERPALGGNVPVVGPLMCSGIDRGQPTGSVAWQTCGGEPCGTAAGPARQSCSMQQGISIVYLHASCCYNKTLSDRPSLLVTCVLYHQPLSF